MFASGRIVDFILVIIVIEGMILGSIYAFRKKGIPPTQFILHALPGAFIFLALRAALVDAGWQPIALFLIASFIAHIIDLIFIIKRA